MSENMMNRSVTAADIAAKLGMPRSSVLNCFLKNSKMSPNKVELVRKTAEQMGYDPQAAQLYGKGSKNRKTQEYPEKKCARCQTTFTPNNNKQKYCLACRQTYHNEYQKKYHGRSMNYFNGNFKTRQEEVAHMKELRARGYSNLEIAKAVGRCEDTVLRAIGKQDRELWKQNVAMGAHIRAQKNAARKQYVVNKPIREYNKRVEEHNALKAKVAQMEAELKPQTPVVEQAAQIKIDFPLIDLHTVQPTALQ